MCVYFLHLFLSARRTGRGVGKLLSTVYIYACIRALSLFVCAYSKPIRNSNKMVKFLHHVTLISKTTSGSPTQRYGYKRRFYFKTKFTWMRDEKIVTVKCDQSEYIVAAP